MFPLQALPAPVRPVPVLQVLQLLPLPVRPVPA